MNCNGICEKYKARGSPSAGRYSSGQKRCKSCQIYIKWEGLWCPCCGFRLRTKPRNKNYKAKHNLRMIDKQRILVKTSK